MDTADTYEAKLAEERNLIRAMALSFGIGFCGGLVVLGTLIYIFGG